MAYKGQRVRLVRTSDPYTWLVPGDEGTVNFIDSLGTVFVTWDRGSGLGLVPGEDVWEELEPTALAWTPDEEVARGTARFRELWPDKWEAWQRWCAQEDEQK